MLSFECIKNEKSVYFLLTSAHWRHTGHLYWLLLQHRLNRYSIVTSLL